MLATDDYLPGVQVLHNSLRRFHARETLVILVTPDIARATRLKLKQLSYVQIAEVPHLMKPNKSTGAWERSQYTKLHIWTLTQFNQVFYIDADCLVLSDLSEIFTLKTDFGAAPDVFPPDCFNAGVLLIKPSLEMFKRLVS